MGKIEKILKKGSVEGQTTEVYPVTSTKAVYDENNKRLDNIITGLQESVYLNTPIPISTDNTPESIAQNVKNIADYVEKAKAAGIADVNGMGVTCLIDDYFSGVGYIMGNTDVSIQGIKTTDDLVDNRVFSIQNGEYYDSKIQSENSNELNTISKKIVPAINEVNTLAKSKGNGTITGVKMNGVSKGTSGVVDLGTVITSHQDISGKADKSAAIGSLSLSLDSTNYKITLSGTKVDGTTFTVSDVIDLPLESVVVNGSYNNTTKKVVLTLQSGSTVEFSVADLVSGLQSEITSTNKLSADLIADGTTNKVVTASEKTTWNGKQDALTNADVLTGITSTKVSNWDNAATNSHTHSNKSVLDGISSTDITNWNSKTDNVGTVTGVKMNGTTNNPTNGVVDLGTVLTEHQDISGKQDKTDNTLATTDKTVIGAINEINTKVSNLTGALTWKGKLDTLPAVTDYEAGNVISVGNKEYVLTVTGSTKAWEELGDEGSYLLKSAAEKTYAKKTDIPTIPAIPTVNNPKVSIKMNGTEKGSFTLNQASAGEVDLGTVITAHQDISGKVDKTLNAKAFEAITILTSNTAEAMNANKAAVQAYVNNLTELGVDITKGFSVPVRIDNNFYGCLTGEYHTGIGYFLSGTIFSIAWGAYYIKDILIDPEGQYMELVNIKNDNGLSTTSKNLIGAINEVNILAKKKQDALTSGTNIKTINNQSLLGSGNIEISAPSITVDTAISDTSMNPVQNKVIKAYIDGLVGNVAAQLAQI